MPRAFRDLREFLGFLEEKGDLLRVRTPVSPRLEMTEISLRALRRGGPALLFEAVEGSSTPVLLNLLATERRIAWALGEEDLGAVRTRIEELLHIRPPGGLGAMIRDLGTTLGQLQTLRSLGPERVTRGKCQEVTEPRVNLEEIPFLTCWPKDGGPTLTFGLVLTKNPESGETNAGIYRMQRYGPDRLGFHAQIHRVGAENLRRYARRGERMPVAVVIGPDPATLFAGLAPVPEGLSKFSFAGFLRGKPVPLLPATSVDLEVPADAEMVLEGYVDPAETHLEGPFGDHTGVYSLPEEFPVMHVTAWTHRSDPIYLSTVTGKPPTEDAILGRAVGEIFLPVIRMILPEVVAMDLPLEGLFMNVAIVAIRKSYPFHARKVMHALWGLGQMMFVRYLVVVDEDVDPRDHREVLYRVGLQADPQEDLELVHGPVDQLSVSNRVPNLGAKLGIDATRKWASEGYARPWPEEARMVPDVQRRVDELIRRDPTLSRLLPSSRP